MADDKLLTVKEAAEFLDISVSHLYKLSSSSKIAHYKPGGKRIYFLQSDLINYVKDARVRTSDEIEQEAIDYAVQ